jgi:hypothetical protein
MAEGKPDGCEAALQVGAHYPALRSNGGHALLSKRKDGLWV